MSFEEEADSSCVKIMNFALKTRNCVSNTRNFHLNDQFCRAAENSMVFEEPDEAEEEVYTNEAIL